MKIEKYRGHGLAMTACAVVLAAGCASGPDSTRGARDGLLERERQNLRYCGPDGAINLASDKASGREHPKSPEALDQLCGKAEMRFIAEGERRFPPVAAGGVKLFRIVDHFEDGGEKVEHNEYPSRAFDVVGRIEFPLRWYYDSTVLEYLDEKLPPLGAHAVLEYHTHQLASVVRRNALTGGMTRVRKMRMVATLIRYRE